MFSGHLNTVIMLAINVDHWKPYLGVIQYQALTLSSAVMRAMHSGIAGEYLDMPSYICTPYNYGKWIMDLVMSSIWNISKKSKKKNKKNKSKVLFGLTDKVVASFTRNKLDKKSWAHTGNLAINKLQNRLRISVFNDKIWNTDNVFKSI